MELQLIKSTADPQHLDRLDYTLEKSQKLEQQLTKSTADPQNVD